MSRPIGDFRRDGLAFRRIGFLPRGSVMLATWEGYARGHDGRPYVAAAVALPFSARRSDVAAACQARAAELGARQLAIRLE